MNVHPHFQELQRRIHSRLQELQTPDYREQVENFPWLVGALGAVPAEVMFIAENPSLTGMRKAAKNTIDAGPPDIEAQWWGGARDNAAKRFRKLLVEFDLKEGAVDSRGGWQCYITNLVKEANLAGKQQRKLTAEQERQQARSWADILSWEISVVRPARVFLIGQKVQEKFRVLQQGGLVPPVATAKMGHYSQRLPTKVDGVWVTRTEEQVLDEMRHEIRRGLKV